MALLLLAQALLYEISYTLSVSKGDHMKKIVLLIAGLALLSGCNETYNGQLELNRSLSFVNNLSKSELSRLSKCKAENSTSRRCKKLMKKKADNTTVVIKGAHKTKVKATNKQITFKILDDNNKTVQSFDVKMNKQAKEKAKKGIIDIKAKDSGFIYNILGELDVDITYSDTYQTYESCTYTESYKECSYEYDVEGNERKTCETITEVYHGEQDVEYRYVYTKKDLDFDVIKTNGEVIGEYAGQYNDTDKDYLYKGTCY